MDGRGGVTHRLRPEGVLGVKETEREWTGGPGRRNCIGKELGVKGARGVGALGGRTGSLEPYV